MDKFADILDLVQAHVEREMEMRIAAIQAITHCGNGAKLCIDCGIQIPEARRRHVPNAHRCAACQEKEERKRRPVPRRA